MPGSATLGQNIHDRLVPVVDDLRQRLDPVLGHRQFKVMRVTRTWTGTRPGDGTYDDVAVEILPKPRVSGFRDLMGRLEPCGIDEAGFVRLDGISLSYTEAELYPVGRPCNEQVYYRLDDAHGQEIRSRWFTAPNPPDPDRTGRDWSMRLVRSWEAAPAELSGLGTGTGSGAGDLEAVP